MFSYVFMIIYLTYNDPPSGIYSSQVIDVVRFMRQELDTKIRLVAFISLRNFFYNKRQIRKELPDALVVPMFPSVQRWRKNSFFLKVLVLYLRPKKIIARSVLACNLALIARLKKTKVVYDGRGAIAAEWKEYGVVNNPSLLAEIEELERQAIQKSHFRIAVSEQLVKHWREQFSYTKDEHVVIPCTLNAAFENLELTSEKITEARKELGLTAEDIVFVYSGSVSGWQSFSLLEKFMVPVLESSPSNKLVFFSPPHKNIKTLQQQYPYQVFCRLLSPNEVPAFLVAGDYGLLIRDESVTNRVASPVKFAEYLACGLKVIINADLGDYSAFVERERCGYVLKGSILAGSPLLIKPVQKQEFRALAMTLFTKLAYKKNYLKTINILKSV